MELGGARLVAIAPGDDAWQTRLGRSGAGKRTRLTQMPK